MPLKTLESGVMGLISINKSHTVKIFDKHTKLIEWRKTPLPLGRYAVYEPKHGGGCGKVIGEFKVCDCTEYLSISLIPPVSIMMGQVKEDFLNAYAKGKPLYANLLCAVKKYDKPKELGEFRTALSDKDIRCKYISKPYNPYGRQVTHCTLQNCYCEFKRLAEQTDCIGYEPLKEMKPLTHPPQSWCRVIESTGGGR